MSWHLECVGTKDEVLAAIEQCMMPTVIAVAMRNMVEASRPAVGVDFIVRSNGDWPMEHSLSTTICEVKLIRRGVRRP